MCIFYAFLTHSSFTRAFWLLDCWNYYVYFIEELHRQCILSVCNRYFVNKIFWHNSSMQFSLQTAHKAFEFMTLTFSDIMSEFFNKCFWNVCIIIHCHFHEKKKEISWTSESLWAVYSWTLLCFYCIVMLGPNKRNPWSQYLPFVL